MKQWELSKYMSELGKKGGIARANKLTPKELSAIAKKAGLASGKARLGVKARKQKHENNN